MSESTRKRMKCFVIAAITISICATLFFTHSDTFVAATNESSNGRTVGSPYFERYSINPESSIGARGINGNWASSTTVEGKTYQEQLDNKLAYIEQLYQDEKEAFVIVDGISLEEVTNIDAIQYMFEASSIYRTLVTVNDVLYIQSRCSFGRVTNEELSTLYDRYVFNLEDSATLELYASYTLEQGKMAIWIVSPDGNFIYQNETSDNFEQTIRLSLDEGLYSVILVCEMDGGQMEGVKFIQGDFK